MKYCSKCKKEHKRDNQRYCLLCHNEYQRNWRKTHKLNVEQKQRGYCRSYAKVYLKRGKIIKSPCIFCGNTKVEMHHFDYSKPIDVIFLCKKHHLFITKSNYLRG